VGQQADLPASQCPSGPSRRPGYPAAPPRREPHRRPRPRPCPRRVPAAAVAAPRQAA
jgi:hypothetical protein